MSELREYLGGMPVDPGVRQTIANLLHDRPLAAQREIVLTAAATFKPEGFKYVSIPAIWKDRLVEATSTVEARQRHRETSLWQGYDPNDPRYPAPTESSSERARREARELLAKKAPEMLGTWDPIARRTISAPVPLGTSFVRLGEVATVLPELRRPERGDAA